MTKRKSTKSALISSVLALLLCFTMLIGTTFAWFTDSVTSAGNIIQSGNLDVEMYWADGDEDPADSNVWTKVDGSAIFNNDKWEPGYVEAKHIKIANEGNLAFKWRLRIVPNGEVEELADVIDVYYIEGATQLTREMLDAATPICTLRDLIDDVDGAAYGALLPTGETATNDYERVGEVTATLAFKMRENAGNEYQGKKIGTDFSLQLMATQYTYEADSFNNQYDKDANPWDGTVDISWYNDTDIEFTLTTAEQLAGLAAIVNGTAQSGVATYATDGEVQTFIDSFAGKTVKLSADMDLDYRAWTPIGNTTNYFEGDFDGQGYTISHLNVNVNTPDADQFAALFGAVRNSEIKNFTMADTVINAVGKKVRAAAVVGIADSDKTNPSVVELNFENITVDGCSITAEASSSSALLGGVVGYCYPANMKNISVSDLTINGKAQNNEVRAAAICGYVCGQNIANNGGTRKAFTVDTFDVENVEINVEGYTVFAGGYAPYTYYGYITLTNGTIDTLKITVDAHEAFVGGLVGYFWRSDNGHTVKDVNITGIDFDVTTDYLGETRVGGMVGTSQSPNTTYTDCYVSGKIVEKCSNGVVNYHAKVGGFVARTYEYAMQTYTNCVADVDVVGSNVAGGFVGNHTSTVTYINCEAKGDVTADIAGGFAGRLTNSSYTSAVTFDGCKASGKVIGTNVAGGIIGSTITYGWNAWGSDAWSSPYAYNVTIKNCEFTGTVTSGTDYCAGVVGEAKMADGVEIVIENTTCEITPTVFPNE